MYVMWTVTHFDSQTLYSKIFLDTLLSHSGFNINTLLHIALNDLNRYVLIGTWLISTQPHLNAILSGGGK